jgi:hypothetical protein
VKEIAELISALASLAYPLVVFGVLILFRSEIRRLLGRLKRGKFLSMEVELDELQQKTEAAEAQIPIVAAFQGEGRLRVNATVIPAAQNEIEEVLREASRSPRVGLILLSSKIESAARILAEGAGLEVSRTRAPQIAVVRALLKAGLLTVEDGDALILFYRVRNRIVHGYDADDEEIARAIDSGTRLLRLLLSRSRPPEGKEGPGG